MNAAQHILIAAVRLYRYVISPAKAFLVGPLGQCRFTPSCSAYAIEALQKHGALAGSWLALKRLARCHPWGACGEDPVPERRGGTPGGDHGPGWRHRVDGRVAADFEARRGTRAQVSGGGDGRIPRWSVHGS